MHLAVPFARGEPGRTAAREQATRFACEYFHELWRCQEGVNEKLGAREGGHAAYVRVFVTAEPIMRLSVTTVVLAVIGYQHFPSSPGVNRMGNASAHDP
jgi:hypothetical protein